MNLFDDNDREHLLERIHRLTPESVRCWGSLSLPAVLAHMGRQISLALGEIEAKPRQSWLRYFGLKYLAIYVMPWPKGVQTAPSLLKPEAVDIDVERQEMVRLIERAAQRGPDGTWADHPMFGRLPGRAWGALMAKHLDHHLRQFSG